MDDGPADLLTRAENAYEAAISDPGAAGPTAAAVVGEARDRNDVEALVVGLKALAWSERTLLADDHARTLLDEAAQIARRAGLEARLGEVLVVRSAVHQELGNPRAAQRDLDTARPLLGSSALAELEHHIAVLHHNANRLRQAAAIYRRILADPEAPAAVRAKDANNLAMIEADLGHYDLALELVEQARGLAAEVGPALTAYFAEGHAVVLAQAGMLPASLEMFETAERLYEKAGLPLAELYIDYADAMSDLRLFPEAARAARRGRDEFDANHIPLMRAEAELRVARLALVSGETSDAEDSALSAATEFRHQGRTGWAAAADVVLAEARSAGGTSTTDDLHRVRRAASTLGRLKVTTLAVDAHLAAARMALEQGRREWAAENLERARALARRAPVLVRLKGHEAAATSSMLLGDVRRSIRESRAGLDDLERHRAALTSIELRVLASAHGAELGRIGLRTLLGDGSPAAVLRWMERTRAAALLAVQRLPTGMFDEELAEMHSLQASMRSSGGGTPEEVARLRDLEDQVRRLTWAAASAEEAGGRRREKEGFRDLLAGRTLVEYGVLDGAVFAVVQGARRTTLTHLCPQQEADAELEKLMFALRLISRAGPVATAVRMSSVAAERINRLRCLLVEPLRLPSDAELVVVPVGNLQRVPWSALHDGPLALAPSAAFWARGAGGDHRAEAPAVFVAGPGLEAAKDEVMRLAGSRPDARVLVPPESTVAATARLLASADLAHFACHGVVRSDNPLFSGLLLSDGLLTVQELDVQGIAPGRVVLAACEAAADVAYAGGESLGFVSALLARGTRGVVGSVIAVPDQAVSALMVPLHEAVGDCSLAVGLNLARARLDRDDPRELATWCAFTAYGAG